MIKLRRERQELYSIKKDLEEEDRNLYQKNASIEKIQKTDDEFHTYLLNFIIPSKSLKGYLYRKNL